MTLAEQGRRTGLAVAVMLFILGFSLVSQLRIQSRSSAGLENLSESDLLLVADSLDKEIVSLRAEVAAVKADSEAIGRSLTGKREILEQLGSEIGVLGTAIGLREESGPGVKITIHDPAALLTGFDLRQLVEELRAAGAFSMTVGGHRVLPSSSFWRAGGEVYMDGLVLSAPYQIHVIGEPMTLRQTLTLTRGMKERLEALRAVRLTIEDQPLMVLPGGGDRVGSFKHARAGKSAD